MIGVEEEIIVEERREDTSGEEEKVNNTSPGRLSIPRSPTTSSQSGGHNPRLRMENQDSTLRLLVFHGTGKDDAKKHWFMSKDIWFVKRIIDEASKIVYLETTFKDRALACYMKYKEIVPAVQTRSLTEIKRCLLREFHKPKSKSQCINNIK
jgi:hypothetical protein